MPILEGRRCPFPFSPFPQDYSIGALEPQIQYPHNAAWTRGGRSRHKTSKKSWISSPGKAEPRGPGQKTLKVTAVTE